MSSRDPLTGSVVVGDLQLLDKGHQLNHLGVGLIFWGLKLAGTCFSSILGGLTGTALWVKSSKI